MLRWLGIGGDEEGHQAPPPPPPPPPQRPDAVGGNNNHNNGNGNANHGGGGGDDGNGNGGVGPQVENVPQPPPPPNNNNNNNANNNGREVVHEIISEEEWFRLNGLANEPRYGSDSYNNQQAAQERVQREAAYASRVFDVAFEEFDARERGQLSQRQLHRRAKFEEWEGCQIEIRTMAPPADDVEKTSTTTTTTVLPPLRFKLNHLASRSDTVFAMASSARFYSNEPTTTTNVFSQPSPPGIDTAATTATGNSNNSNSNARMTFGFALQVEKPPTLTLNLQDYPRAHVEAFLRVLSTQWTPSQIPDDAVVDCCRLAHYLQCHRYHHHHHDHHQHHRQASPTTTNNGNGNGENDNGKNATKGGSSTWVGEKTALVQEISDVCLIPSVDSDNCMSLCQLADQFGLDSLREKCLNQMMTSLSSLESHEFWDELPAVLRSEIEKMRQIMRGSNRKTLYFNSCREYIALLEEQYEYHVERLMDAQTEQVQFAKELGVTYRTHSSWLYAQFKIERHASKVRALKEFLDEQKRVFGSETMQP